MRRFSMTLLSVLGITLSLAAATPKKDENPAARPAEKKSDKPAAAADAKPADASDPWSGLEFRSIGPAVTEGRIADIAVDPSDPRRRFVAVASGGVWKTENAGTTWTPVFDGEASYSTGCVTIDPKNPSVIWVGTGENDSQRSVSYGDGVYRSEDGGKSWKNMGLKTSEHIARILIDPRDSSVVYVASQGPLWSAGGERGLYKTTDSGRSWTAVLTISENTGVTDLAMDPRDPDVLYAASFQRRRHVWTVINGGPESAIYKSTDAGKSWSKLTSGLPAVDRGRIGLAVAPSNPDMIYATIEAAQKKGGVFRSTDRGATWEKRSDHVSSSGQYYKGVVIDPRNPDLVYFYDTWISVSHDGGKTFSKWGETNKHPDNHAIWIDPSESRHLLVGCDGGLYETFDTGATWLFDAKLPVTQFYRVALDNAKPYYNVYGGTQDNFSLGGPSRTGGSQGITNADWFVTSTGDGFFSAVDPTDPNIIYSEAQYGALNRMDRRTGEQLYIQPIAAPGEAPLRWNWDSPIIVSAHDHNRIYFAAQRLFQSDDRGNTWKPISGDLTRQIDRNTLKIMGKVWPVDAVAKNTSTSFYGNIVALSESPKKEGLIYVGTDDGLIQVTENGGASWRKIARVPGVPETTYVSRVAASLHDDRVVYASFDNHQMGDFKPYLMKSSDRGLTWTSIASNLPARGTVYVVAQDPIDSKLLFCGTEFGVFFSQDEGGHWHQLKGGLPTIAVRDIAIQSRENDLAIATFGRGFYILDDYSPLRTTFGGSRSFPVRTASVFVPSSPYGIRGKAFQGDGLYAAPNPPFGALLTYSLKDDQKTLAQRRRDAEKVAETAGKTPPYPTLADLRAEDAEKDPEVLIAVTDASGSVVRRLTGPAKAGIHRIAWDLRFPPSEPATLTPPKEDPFSEPPEGPLVVPGKYTVSFSTVVNGATTPFGEPQTFEVGGLYEIPRADREKLLEFERKTARLQRAVLGSEALLRQTAEQLKLIEKALEDTPNANDALFADARALEARRRDLVLAISGDEVAARHSENSPPSISDRVNYIVGTQWTATSAPTQTSLDAYRDAATAFKTELANLKQLVAVDLVSLEQKMEKAGAPWTPGRVPEWSEE